MNVYNGRIGQIAQEIFRSRIEARHVNAGHYMPFKHHISFATDLAANFGFNWFRIMPDIISTLLSATIWSWCAVRVESEQTPFPLSCLFRPAALHRIQFGTCGFVSMSYFSRYFATCNQFFCVQDCHSRIVQVEYQGQTRSTRILERKPLINTSYHIRHRLELKYFHLAQFFLYAHRAAHPPRKSENW